MLAIIRVCLWGRQIDSHVTCHVCVAYVSMGDNTVSQMTSCVALCPIRDNE